MNGGQIVCSLNLLAKHAAVAKLAPIVVPILRWLSQRYLDLRVLLHRLGIDDSLWNRQGSPCLDDPQVRVIVQSQFFQSFRRFSG